jgi:nucleotide-binding universal stress UspA family protein
MDVIMKTILHPTDFSTTAWHGLQYAHALARRTHSRLILMHSLDIIHDSPADSSYLPSAASASQAAAAQRRLDQLFEGLREQEPGSQVVYETVVRYENPTAAVSGVARDKGADLIVMGTQGAKGVFSSVAAEVIEEAPCPVLVIPAGTPLNPIRQIVFTTDLKQNHPSEMAEVVELAFLLDARIIFLHVLTEGTEKAREQALNSYNKTFATLQYENLSFQFIEHNDVEEGIFEFSEKVGADLLVMAHRSRNFWQGLFRDSLTKQMARHARYPLLAIH